ncbi:hypothetical protein [Actinomadura violacea]|uniref:Uncharacterized protein n=1 Tax=Actinomadura violacea TaxID=2819934 RepID=A0ABS3S076_9ACTN|nr:hypothetical protein [Actinomadura violacea]MBO2462409.1 hypothetical protein [Actinomadura violacea]
MNETLEAMMDRETEFLICAVVLTGTAVTATIFPAQTVSLLLGVVVGAFLKWALLKRH